MSAPLAELMGLGRGSVAAVVGCGGKSTLIALLCAQAPEDWRVLVSTTTKIYPPPYARITEIGEMAPPRAGAQAMGACNPRTGKLEAPPPELLKQAASRFDLVLLEADGSRGLPAKGWRADEPVIPAYATHTVGVLPLRALGLPATGEFVLRVPEFLALTGLQYGEIITERALSNMVGAPGGMFARRRGQAHLLVNQVERDADIPRAKQLLARMRGDWPRLFDGLFYGSAHRGTWRALGGELS